MARTQYTFTFTNAAPGAPVTFSSSVFASKTAQVAEGPTLALDSTRTVAVWSDATELTATWVDGAGTSVAAEASVAIPVVKQTVGTPGAGPEPADTAETTRATAAEGLKLAKASNLSDVADPVAARANLGAAQLLTRGAVKTGNYTATAGELVPCDTTSAAFTITLPAAPAVGTRIAVKIVTLGAGHFVTIACGGSDVFNKTGGATTASLQLLGHAMNLQYDAGAIWTVVADDVPLSQLNGSYLQADPGPLTLSHGASAPSSPTTDQLWVDTGTVAGDFDVAGAAAAAQTAAIAASVPKTLFTAKGSLVAASLASTPTEVTVGADGTGLVADSTQTGGVAWKQRSRSVADVHTDGSVVNSTTNTVVATLAVPTTVAAGDILRAVFIGDMLNNTGSSVNYEWTLTLGATAALQTPVTAVTATSLRHPFRATCEILVVDPTSDQRLNVHSLFMGGTASTWALVSASPGTGRGTAAENLTAGKNLTLAVAMFTASASADFYCHEAYLEVIKR